MHCACLYGVKAATYPRPQRGRCPPSPAKPSLTHACPSFAPHTLRHTRPHTQPTRPHGSGPTQLRVERCPPCGSMLAEYLRESCARRCSGGSRPASMAGMLLSSRGSTWPRRGSGGRGEGGRVQKGAGKGLGGELRLWLGSGVQACTRMKTCACMHARAHAPMHASAQARGRRGRAA